MTTGGRSGMTRQTIGYPCIAIMADHYSRRRRRKFPRLGCDFILRTLCYLGSPQSALVLSYPGKHVAVERVEVVVIRDIMSDHFSINDVTLALMAGFVQSLEGRGGATTQDEQMK